MKKPVLFMLAMLCVCANAYSSQKGIVYTLVEAGSWPADVRKHITNSMDEAVKAYNDYGRRRFRKELHIVYDPSVPTADGNYNGTIRFGNKINTSTAMHEISHTLGIGQHQRYWELMKNGEWTKHRAIRQLYAFDGEDAVLKGDHSHFWPYGLNFDTEDSKEERKRHVLMVYAMLRDMRIETLH